MSGLIIGILVGLFVGRILYLIRGDGSLNIRWTDQEKEWLESADYAERWRKEHEGNNNN